MLWHKAWLETRSRFLLCLCGVIAFPSYFVLHEDRMGGPYAHADWYYRTLNNGHSVLAAMWVAAILFLMMGGLLREKASGTAAFTLALPVSRARLMRVRILAGLAEAEALVIIPWAVMYLIAIATGLASSLPEALFHVALLAGGGILFFALAVLISSAIEGEYTAPTVAFGIVFADAIGLSDPKLRPFSPWNFLMGTEYIDGHTQRFPGPFPVLHLLEILALAAVLIAVSIKLIQRREF